MHFKYMPVASEFVSTDNAITEIILQYITDLEQSGGQRIQASGNMTEMALFYFAVTGGVENSILQLSRERKQKYPDEPVYILAHPGNNSLPASLEILARLHQDGVKGRIFYINPSDISKSVSDMAKAVHYLEVFRKLQKARIGCIGAPSDWLIASMPSPETVKQAWGPEVIPLTTERVMHLMKCAGDDELRQFQTSLVNGASAIIEPDAREISDVVRVYMALKQISTENKLDALTIRCFDLVQSMKTTGCFALAELTDEGIIAGCEGDMMSTIGLFWANKLTGMTPWMANPAQLDERNNRLWLAHCTVPRKLVNGYKLRSHFESGLGLGIQGTWDEGPVTLLRIGGKNMEKLWLAEGTILGNGNSENLCRTQLEIQLENGGNVRDLLSAPLGNHIVLINGHYMRDLLDWHATMR